MDPNLTQPPQPVAEPPKVPVTPPSPLGNDTGGSSNKIWIIMIVVAVLIVVGIGVFMYMQSQSKSETVPTPTTTTQQDDLQAELDSVQIEDIDKDFAETDKDIQNL